MERQRDELGLAPREESSEGNCQYQRQSIVPVNIGSLLREVRSPRLRRKVIVDGGITVDAPPALHTDYAVELVIWL